MLFIMFNTIIWVLIDIYFNVSFSFNLFNFQLVILVLNLKISNAAFNRNKSIYLNI